MKRSQFLAHVVLTLELCAVVPRASQAQGTPIGLYNFTEGTNGAAFHYHSNPGFANGTFDFSTAPGSPGTFSYTSPAAFGCPPGLIAADIAMSGSAIALGFAVGPFVVQPISFDLVFTGAATSPYPGANLLTVDATGFLFGFPDGTTAGIVAQTVFGDTIAHSTALCSIPVDTDPKDLSYSLSALTVPLNLGPDLDFESFEAQLSGNGSASVPEPGAVSVLLGTFLLASLAFARRPRS